jgi:hypothetical protein
VVIALLGALAVPLPGGASATVARLYCDRILDALSERDRITLDTRMSIGKIEYKSDFARRYYGAGLIEGEARGEARGKAEGKAEAILAVLRAHGIALSQGERERILACEDTKKLDAWIERAVAATRAAELFRES